MSLRCFSISEMVGHYYMSNFGTQPRIFVIPWAFHVTYQLKMFSTYFCLAKRITNPDSYYDTLRSQIEGYTRYINFQEIFHPTLCYLSLPVYKFSIKFPASLFFHLHKLNKFPPYSLLLDIFVQFLVQMRIRKFAFEI